MLEQYSVIQTPESITLEDLPEEIELNIPFDINGIEYVLVKSENREMKVVDENGPSTGLQENVPSTGLPNKVSHFYSIKRL